MAGTTKQMRQILDSFFPEIDALRDRQAEVIVRCIEGEALVYLAPTGIGKSLVYQVAGMARGGLTLVISPLRALISQQCRRLQQRGIAALELHADIRGCDQFRLLRDLARPSSNTRFVFISPERGFADGYLEHIIRQVAGRIGLVVVDEAHCISQWGHGFRPAYKAIPDFLRRVFPSEARPPVLCLTATLNPHDCAEICADFCIPRSGVVQSQHLLRANLQLAVETHRDEQAKRQRLMDLLAEDPQAKTVVYVHRKKSKWGTRSLAKDFAERGFACDYFDADRDRASKERVLQEFERGRIRIVFATNAFGMGVDIPDIRRVVHYLLPESIEQYYQEVGRAGRDGKTTQAVLLFSPVNVSVRRELIAGQFPDAERLQKVFAELELGARPVVFNTYETYADDSIDLQAFHLLHAAGVVRIVCRGVGSLRPFSAAKPEPFFDEVHAATRTGQLSLVADRLGLPLTEVSTRLFDAYTRARIELDGAPGKCLFLVNGTPLDDRVLPGIISALDLRRNVRLAAFERLVSAVEAGRPMEEAVSRELGLLQGYGAEVTA